MNHALLVHRAHKSDNPPMSRLTVLGIEQEKKMERVGKKEKESIISGLLVVARGTRAQAIVVSSDS